MTIREEIDYINDRTRKHQERTRRELEAAIRGYLIWRNVPYGTIEQQVEQGIAAVDSMTGKGIVGGVETVDTRTLATD